MLNDLAPETVDLVLSSRTWLLHTESLLHWHKFVVQVSILGPQIAHFRFNVVHAGSNLAHHFALVQRSFQLSLQLGNLALLTLALFHLGDERCHLLRQRQHWLALEESFLGEHVFTLASKLDEEAVELLQSQIQRLDGQIAPLDLLYQPLVLLLTDTATSGACSGFWAKIGARASQHFRLFRGSCAICPPSQRLLLLFSRGSSVHCLGHASFEGFSLERVQILAAHVASAGVLRLDEVA